MPISDDHLAALIARRALPGRRKFLGDAAAAAAAVLGAGFGLGRSASAFVQQDAARRQVVVAGRRVRTVDVHAHCAFPEVMALMNRQRSAQDPLIMGPERFRQMDARGIDVAALSINPYWYSAERSLASRIVALQNEKLAELCARHPDRLVACATVALQDPPLAAQQLEDGVKQFGLRGAEISTQVNGEELAAPKFDPFWAKAEELGVLIMMHPQAIPELDRRLAGSGMLSNIVAFPLATTIALSHLIFQGTLDRFPGLKICASHGGGYLGSYIARSDRSCLAFPENCDRPLKKRPSEYLKQLYVDSIVFSAEALRHLVVECGASQIVLGTDYPFPWTVDAVDHILDTPGLSDADREAMLGGTLSALLRLPPA
jgi:predicted TIM-barrel fold metal-dependent hydrolase